MILASSVNLKVFLDLVSNESKCWTCDVQNNDNLTNEAMWDACANDGQEETCQGEATSCFTIERQSNLKKITMIQMGCKQKQACKQNKL